MGRKPENPRPQEEIVLRDDQRVFRDYYYLVDRVPTKCLIEGRTVHVGEWRDILRGKGYTGDLIISTCDVYSRGILE